MPNETIILGGGCFWCIEEAYRYVPGVISVQSGYAGGTTINPDYKDVCSGSTGHAEVVKIEFDTDRTNLEKILDFFWHIHDPTTLNRQGVDIGTQYRSIIIVSDEGQKKAAEDSITQLNNKAIYDGACTTEIVWNAQFYPAEEYHQRYFQRNPEAGYCKAVIAPKLAKVRKIRFD
ncbi:peptide-methionine (S)-S-oxide reductase MsrA [Spirochaeta dissipatitropha]